MCEGVSSASCRIHSPRSVSTGTTPASIRASLRPISSDTIDFAFTATRASVRAAMSRTTARAASASEAQWTLIPFASAAASNRSRCSSRCSSASDLMALARPRRA